MKDHTVSAKVSTQITKEGPMKVRCSWDKNNEFQEGFLAAFIEFKLATLKGFHRDYKRVVAMLRNKTVLWSNRPEWEHIMDDDRAAGTGEVHAKSAHLDLYATNKSCATQQGFYRCTISVIRQPGRKIRFYNAHKKWMTIPCMHEYGRLKSKIAWGEGGSDSEQLEQYFFEMQEVSGDNLAQSSTQDLVILAHRKFTYSYKGKKRTFDALECRPSKGLMERVTFVLGFVIELQQYAKDYSLPICGINDRGDTVWSDITYWRQSYLCGPKTRCPMGFGSVVDDPHIVMYIDDCMRNLGLYKCHVFVQLAGSPASEETEADFSVVEDTCKSDETVTNQENKEEEKENDFVIYNTSLPAEVKEKESESPTGLIIVISFTALILLIAGFLGYSTQKKIKQKREEEQRLIQMYHEKPINEDELGTK